MNITLEGKVCNFDKVSANNTIYSSNCRITFPEIVPLTILEDDTGIYRTIGECKVEEREDGLYAKAIMTDTVPFHSRGLFDKFYVFGLYHVDEENIMENNGVITINGECLDSIFMIPKEKSADITLSLDIVPSHYSKIKTCCIENGPGVRTSVFFSGCRRHCPGCHNQEAWDFEHGKDFNWDTIQDILKTIEPEWVSGLSILGGEPLEPENLYWVARLIAAFREKFGHEKTIWLYTGYTYEDILLNSSWDVYHVVNSVDVLVDGPYLEAEKDAGLAYRGSRNQRMIDIPKTKNSYEIVLWEWDA